MATQDIIRSDPFTWGMRWFQLIITIAILAITGHQSTWWHQEGCSTPSDLALNISAAAITLTATIYFLCSSGQKNLVHILPWHRYIALSVDIVLLIFWIITITLAPYDCGSLCTACSAVGSGAASQSSSKTWMLIFGGLSCQCTSNGISHGNDKRWLVDQNEDIRWARSILEGRNVSGSNAVQSTYVYAWSTPLEGVLQSAAVKMGLDGAMLALILSTLIWTAALVTRHRNKNVPEKSESKDTGIELIENSDVGEHERDHNPLEPLPIIDISGPSAWKM